MAVPTSISAPLSELRRVSPMLSVGLGTEPQGRSEVHTIDAWARASVRRCRLLMGLVLVLWLGCELAAWAGFSRSPLFLASVNLLTSPFYGPAVAGFCFLHLLCRPGRREVAATIAVGVVLGVGPALLWRWLEWAVPLLNTAALGFGLASLLTLTWRAWISRGATRARTLALLLPVCLARSS